MRSQAPVPIVDAFLVEVALQGQHGHQADADAVRVEPGRACEGVAHHGDGPVDAGREVWPVGGEVGECVAGQGPHDRLDRTLRGAAGVGQVDGFVEGLADPGFEFEHLGGVGQQPLALEHKSQDGDGLFVGQGIEVFPWRVRSPWPLPCGPLIVEYLFDRVAYLEAAVPRGSRFAAGKEPSRDRAGRSLPSDRDMAYVELQIVCAVCSRVGVRRPILGAWWIESHHAAFDPAEVNERANKCVERQLIGDRLRYKLSCPRCPATPVLKGERIDQALELVYEQGARAKVEQVPL